MMKIRYILKMPILLVLLTNSHVMGQDAQEGMGDARLLLQAGREEIIRDELRLSDEEAATFWPAYDAYQSDLMVVRNRYADLLGAYLEAYRAGTVTEEFAEQLIDDYLEMQGDILQIKKDHLENFRKALPALKAARFYQLENKMEAELEGQLALVVPLIDPV